MDFREKSQHYLRIAQAMKEAGKSEAEIEEYLKNEKMDHNEIFLIMDQLERGVKVPEMVSRQGGKMKKLFGIPFTILGGVFLVAGLVLGGMKLYVGGPFDWGYISAIAAIIAGVTLFIQGKS